VTEFWQVILNRGINFRSDRKTCNFINCTATYRKTLTSNAYHATIQVSHTKYSARVKFTISCLKFKVTEKVTFIRN